MSITAIEIKKMKCFKSVNWNYNGKKYFFSDNWNSIVRVIEMTPPVELGIAKW